MYIQKNENIPKNTFSFNTPFYFNITGTNISQGGPYDLQIYLTSVSVTTYFSNQETLAFDGPPTYTYSIQEAPILLTLNPPDNINSFNFNAFVYGGILNLSNINLLTEPGFIYDIKLSFDTRISSSNNTNTSFINNTSVSMFINLTNDAFYNIYYRGLLPFDDGFNPTNCRIDSIISSSTYSPPSYTTIL